jgi:hypothetical protein
LNKISVVGIATIAEALKRDQRDQSMAMNDHHIFHHGDNKEINIHEECMSQCRSSILLKCIQLHPGSLALVNELGCLPLHILLENMSSSIEQALMMIEKHPAALEHPNTGGSLPIHIECSHRARSSVLSKCIELYPESLEIPDMQGCLPLNRLFGNKSSSEYDALKMIEKYPAALQYQNIYGYLPIHVECYRQCRSSIISKCIELYPEALDAKAMNTIIKKVDKSNFSRYSSVLSSVFTTRPMSLYDHQAYIQDDIRLKPYYRRRILNLLPRHIFTPKHDADYRDLNWQPRAAMVMLLSQIQQQSRQHGSYVALLVESLLDMSSPGVVEPTRMVDHSIINH